MRAFLLALTVALAALASTACGSADNGGVIEQRTTTTLSTPGRY